MTDTSPGQTKNHIHYSLFRQSAPDIKINLVRLFRNITPFLKGSVHFYQIYSIQDELIYNFLLNAMDREPLFISIVPTQKVQIC